jgi:hypothetical protein
MKTKHLVVGQEVYMVSGPYMNQGQVVRTVPFWRRPWHLHAGTAVEVQTAEELVHLNKHGVSCHGSSTYEAGPWELNETQGLHL